MHAKSFARDVSNADVAVIIVNFRTPELTAECLSSLANERKLVSNLRAIVVDGGSGDDSASRLGPLVERPEYRQWVKFMPLSINGGFGWANNQAILSLAREESPPEFVYLLNPDAQVLRGAVAALIEDLRSHDRCGAAGSQLMDPDRNLSASAFRFPSPGREFVTGSQSERLGRLFGVGPAVLEPREAAEVDWVTGASVMFRMAALREVGPFDDGFFLYFDEVELMHRLRRCGWTVRYVPASRVIHHEGASTGLGERGRADPLPDYWYRSRRRYFALTGGRSSVAGVNLSLLAGRSIGIFRSLVRPRGRPASDILRAIRPGGPDTRPSVPRLGEAPGRPPFWMSDG